MSWPLPVGTRVVRTVENRTKWGRVENLDRRGTITGYENHPSLSYYKILFDGDTDYACYVVGHAGIVELSAVDQLAEVGRVERALVALDRGMRDGLRLQRREVSAAQLCEELANDPP